MAARRILRLIWTKENVRTAVHQIVLLLESQGLLDAL